MKTFKIIFMITIYPMTLYVSEHKHDAEHDKQLSRMINLGKRFDQETAKAGQGKSYNVTGIFKAQHRLASSMICITCQRGYQAIIAHNRKVIIPEILHKLKTGELPIEDNERGHYV